MCPIYSINYRANGAVSHSLETKCRVMGRVERMVQNIDTEGNSLSSDTSSYTSIGQRKKAKKSKKRKKIKAELGKKERGKDKTQQSATQREKNRPQKLRH